MTEKDLVELWNDKRAQLTKTQFHSVVAIAVLVILAVLGDMGAASQGALIFAAIFLVTVGSLGILTQFAIIREARSVVEELGKLGNLGPVATNISRSGGFLTMTQGLMVVFSLAVIAGFAVVVLL
jgi:asparagine N-glycosylation enzyme membrane subunit Stt3